MATLPRVAVSRDGCFDTAAFAAMMTMMDEEGELSTPNVNARFVDGDPVGLVVRYEMTTPAAFDRFIRFMGRYAEANGLNFNKA